MPYAIRRSVLLGFLLAIAGSSAAIARDPTIGEKPTFQSDDSCSFGRTEDQKAFQLACTGFESTVGAGTPPAAAGSRTRSAASDAPIASRVFSVVIPISDGKRASVPFSVSGFVLTTEGAEATLLVRVNEQNTIVKFGPKSDRGYAKNFIYRTPSASELRVTLFLLTERKSTSSDASAFLGVNVVNAGKKAK
jgi:hypothetical protein